MVKIRDQIEELNKEIIELKGYIVEITKSFNENLKNENNSDKELKEIGNKLLACQKQKEEIQKELNTEIAKVKNSNLSNEEKSKQIIALTTNNHQQFTTTCQQLSNAWQSYHQIQQKVIKFLESQNQTEQTLKDLKKTNQNQFLITTSLIVISLLTIVFGLLYFRKKNKKIGK